MRVMAPQAEGRDLRRRPTTQFDDVTSFLGAVALLLLRPQARAHDGRRRDGDERARQSVFTVRLPGDAIPYRGHPITQRISWEDGRDAAPVLLPHGRPSKGSRPRSQIKRGANRAYVLARLRRDERADLIEKVESGALSVRGALAAMTTLR